VVTGYRKTSRQPQESLDDGIGLIASAQSVEELVIAAEQHAELRALLDSLPDDQRQLLELRLAGLNAAEIGRTLGRSHESVRKAQSRAIIGLRDALNRQQRQSNPLDGKRNG
jgi:RNA polymerase sigma factor (sigma-70 family)